MSGRDDITPHPTVRVTRELHVRGDKVTAEALRDLLAGVSDDAAVVTVTATLRHQNGPNSEDPGSLHFTVTV